MRRQFQSLLLLGLSSLVAAIYKDEVGHVDFHHSLVGIPQRETTFFHRPRTDDKASLLYTLSDLGVVGAVNPTSGELVWRQQVSQNVTNGAGFLRAPEGENWVAAASGRSVQAWNAMTGRNVWQVEFDGEVKDLEILELTESSRKDVLVLFDEDGTTVLRRLHGGLGNVIWEFRETSKDIPLQVSTNIANVYVISLHGSASSYNIKTTSIDMATGKRADQWTVGSKGDVTDAKDVMFVGANSAAPVLAWTNSGLTKLNMQIIGTKTKQEVLLAADTISVDIHAPHLTQSQPHFLVHTHSESGNKGEVYHIDLKGSQINKAYELPQIPGRGAISTTSNGANVYFTRIMENEVQLLSSDSHDGLARWPIKQAGGLKVMHAVSEVIRKSGDEFAVRSAVLADSQDWLVIRNGEQDWSRPEGLSGSVAAVWADIPHQENLAKVLAEEAHTNPLSAYIHRVKRHIEDLQHLPAYIAGLPASIVSSLLGGEGSTHTAGVHADSFGFNKIIVLVTRRGRFYALNSGNHGEVVWSKDVFPQPEGKVLEVKGMVVQDDNGMVSMRGSKGELAVINALNGQVEDFTPSGPTEVVSTAIIEDETSEWLLPLGADGVPTSDKPRGQVGGQTIVIRGAGETIKGIKLIQEGDKLKKQEVWELKSAAGQRIVDVDVLPANEPVASIGRVLADRGVSYKYLNPNTAVVALMNDAASTLSIKLVDTISGQVLVAETHDGVDGAKSISCTMAENWYACSFFGQYKLNDATERSIKGYQVVVSDLYESPNKNDRGPLGDADKFSSLEPVDTPTGAPLPYVVSQSWVISQPFTKLSVTQTRQGIANRQIVAYLPESHAVVTMPRMVLDPRRPVGRDPTAAEMEAEGLAKYSPAIEIDPRTIVSHDWDILGIEGFAASPALVESTSLLVAYGIDVYGTRVSPSGLFDILGKGFNKVTLLSTVFALMAGVMFVAPMVRRRQINRRWEAFI
ncbi:hypothetical protein K4F52_004499 [Lecanicillium sp. MT-2017a]|nr:hypothetical protein K4F52_004499 [Lecanicillium sp. MT-2017a]